MIDMQRDESLILIGEEWAKLRYKDIIKGTLEMRSKADALLQGNVSFVEGRDYLVDYSVGKIKRTPHSPMPDWSLNVFYNQKGFDHTLYESYGNYDYTVYLDYEYETSCNRTIEHISREIRLKESFKGLGRTVEKLKRGENVKYIVFGDSISTGAEASSEGNKYYNRFADRLRAINPDSKVELFMRAMGGEDSRGALKRVEEDVVLENPELVSIAYGMNDQNRGDNGGHFVEPEEFDHNIREILEKLLKNTSAEVILVTSCIPNPGWKYSSGDSKAYSDIVRKIGTDYNIAVADAEQLWLEELRAGKSCESLLMNNINHPNDYGHFVYFKALESLL